MQAAQLFQSNLAEVGINLKIVGDTWGNMTQNAGKPETTPDMWVHWISTYFVDPENWVGQMYDSQFHGTWKASCWYSNAKVDALLRQARGTLGQEGARRCTRRRSARSWRIPRISGSTTRCSSRA